MSFVKQQEVRHLAVFGLGLWLLTSGCVSDGGRLRSNGRTPRNYTSGDDEALL